MAFQLVCGDILQFQEQLKQMRAFDDKLVYSLNMSLPTASIKARTDSSPEKGCKILFDSLAQSYKSREKVIQDCIVLTADQVSQLKKQREATDDIKVEKKFKSEQRKLRVLKTEQSVEEIVKEQTIKAFNERCRQFYHAASY